MLQIRHPNRLSTVTAIITFVSTFCGAPPARAQDAYYSWRGQFQNATDTQSFLFGLTDSVSSAETLYFTTLSHSGGTNAASESVPSGGFDPVLSLFDGDGASYGANDDGYPIVFPDPNRDSYLTWLTQAPNPAATGITTDPLPSDGYVVKLTAFGGTFPSPWAVDLVAPASKMAFTGLSATGSTIDSLKFGTTGAGSAWAELSLAQLDTLTIANTLYVGGTGKGTLTSLGLINSSFASLGHTGGSEGSVTLTASGNWLSSSDVMVGNFGTGTLLIQGGAVGSFSGNATLANYSIGQGDVTVRDNGSLMVVGGDLDVGDGGIGTLSIEGGGWVNSSGVGTLSRDVIGNNTSANGAVTVTGSGVGGASRWDTDILIVADNGTGTLNVLAGGRVNSTAVEIATITVSATGNATVNGTDSLWDIAGSLEVGTTQISLFNNATLTIENGGAVHVAGATTVNNTGTLNLTGSTLKTGSLSVTGPLNFNWTAGTLELTNSDVSLDSFFPDSVLGSTPTIGTGQALILSNAAGLGNLYVARTGTASMTINGGGDVTANDIYLAYNTTGNANMTVSGNGSTLTVNGDLEVGDGGTATMRIELGAVVDSSAVGPLSRDVIGDDANGWADGTVEVVDPGSQWHTDDLIVGDGGSGILHVLAGGNVSSQNVLIGQNNTGTVNVDGFGSNWQLGTLTVGSGPGGPGNVNLTNQATINSGSVIVGTNATNGNVTINGFTPGFGARATWNVTGSMTLGSSGLGSGTVIVENAGLLNFSDSIDVTGSVDSAPSLTVRTNGEVTVTNNLNIGQGGSVNLQDAGSRITTGTFTKSSTGAFNWTAGTLEISASELHLDSVNPDSVFGNSLTVDAGMRLVTSNPNINAAFDIGQVGSGVGSLSIINGGTVDSYFVHIGEGNTTTGTGLVNGLGSRWDVLTDLRIGDRGSANGQLQIQNQAIVTANGVLLGRADTAHGGLSVDGSGSQLSVNVTLEVAGGWNGSGYVAGGTGSLTVNNGGVIDVGSILRVWPGGSASVDPGSRIDVGTGVGPTGNLNVLAYGLLSGSGQVFGNVNNDGGRVAPGTSAGTLTINGGYLQTQAGILEIELDGNGLGLFDQLNLTGSANLAGNLELFINPPFMPSIGDSFDILNAGLGVFGRFDSVLFPLIPSSGLGLIYGSNTVTVYAGLMGDLNADGFVGVDDLNIVLVNWNQNVDAGVWLQGDPTGEGFVGVDDLNVVLVNWNNGTPPGTPSDLASPVIPEPGTLALLGLGALSLPLRRRWD